MCVQTAPHASVANGRSDRAGSDPRRVASPAEPSTGMRVEQSQWLLITLERKQQSLKQLDIRAGSKDNGCHSDRSGVPWLFSAQLRRVKVKVSSEMCMVKECLIRQHTHDNGPE